MKKALKIKDLTVISWRWNTFFLIILVAFAVTTVYPIALLIIGSFSSIESIVERGLVFFPSEWSLRGYEYLFEMGDQLWRSYLVSFEYATFGTALSLLNNSLFAYVLYQRNFPFRKFYTWFLFITMIFSGGLIPAYILKTRYLHLNDTFFLFLMEGFVAGGTIIILRAFMKTALPDTLVEAARIDGAGHFRIHFFIVLPLMKAGLATQALFGFVGRWNDWFNGLLYMEKPSLIPLQTLLWRMQQNLNLLINNPDLLNSPDAMEFIASLPRINIILACTTIAIVPVLVVYPFFQRYFVRGMLVGSLKE